MRCAQLERAEFTGFVRRKTAELSGNPDLSEKTKEPPLCYPCAAECAKTIRVSGTGRAPLGTVSARSAISRRPGLLT
jgi:hypothetical protein